MSSTPYGVPEEVDVIVIGGGPAGATTAGLLAKKGHRVLLLDRERFPRYHVGESLIPAFIRPMEELGITARMDERGFERKQGGTLVWGNNKIPWNFAFSDYGPHAYAFHTRRADLDSMILDRARELGVFVLEEATVKEPVENEDGRVTGIRFTLRGTSEPYEASARLVVDASGQSRLISRRYSTITWHEELQNVAVWTYFDNCRRLEGEEYTNILIEGLTNGWFWAIPIDKGTISVGYVTRAADVSGAGRPMEQIFADEVAKSTKLQEMLADANQAAGWRSARDWSYTNDRFYGDGWVCVGDAAAFVDPLFSTGVALATMAGSILSRIVDVALKNPAAEQEALKRYATAYRSFFDEIRTFVERFYDRTKYKEFYHSLAQEFVDPERELKPTVSFVKLISGLSGRHPLLNLQLDDLIEPEPAALK